MLFALFLAKYCAIKTVPPNPTAVNVLTKKKCKLPTILTTLTVSVPAELIIAVLTKLKLTRKN